ncbi:MAG: DegT/DnrJ/EryC1/StrS family aminotransferase [Eubacteriales bacterium]|nr:DegT/DnrJ/EryC1/StrS family aminotransferase [Eubacteriales bacterium]
MNFRDLKEQYRVLKTDIDKAISNCLNEGQFILGSDVMALEQELADYVGVKHCISCANGTDALVLSIMNFSIGAGDAVFAPDFTYFATINCAMLRGATPVLVDIEKDTFNISPEALETAIINTKKEGKLNPKAIITVDLFGLCADYPKIQAIAKKYNLLIIEDGAQGFGSSINGKKACSFADIGTISFFPAKPLGCYGDGGAIFTNNDEWADNLRSIRMQGRSKEDKYDNRSIGINSRLDSLQAAVLRVKLKAFKDYELKAVNDVAKIYTDHLSSIVATPTIPDGFYSSWAQYTIRLKDRSQRDGLKEYLHSKGIPTMIYYPRGMHSQTAVVNSNCNSGFFPNTDEVVQTCLSLPMHPYLNPEDQNLVIDSIKEFIG